MKALALLILALALPVLAVEDPRYCGPPARDADGTIKRSRQVLRDFQRIHPCPSTGKTHGKCDGWAINHTIPLSACGCDSIENLAWMPSVLKSGPGTLPVDRWERRIYKCPGSAIEITPMPDSSKFRLDAVPR